MKLFLLTSLTMFSFAANSVLNRLALADGAIDPASFGLVRVVSAAVVLGLFLQIRGQGLQRPSRRHLVPVASLAAYIVGFSFAYITLDTGIGALILFGGVQVTMFCGALIEGEKVTRMRWAGALLAFGGLAYLLAPSNLAPDLGGAVLMGVAALGWGIYSLLGRRVENPAQVTGENFLYAVPIVLVIWAMAATDIEITKAGFGLAVVSGAVTSGMGYALWYAILPKLDATLAAVAQLSVPIIALAGGVVFLAEAVTWHFGIACVLVLGGVAVSAFGTRGAKIAR